MPSKIGYTESLVISLFWTRRSCRKWFNKRVTSGSCQTRVVVESVSFNLRQIVFLTQYEWSTFSELDPPHVSPIWFSFRCSAFCTLFVSNSHNIWWLLSYIFYTQWHQGPVILHCWLITWPSSKLKTFQMVNAVNKTPFPLQIRKLPNTRHSSKERPGPWENGLPAVILRFLADVEIKISSTMWSFKENICRHTFYFLSSQTHTLKTTMISERIFYRCWNWIVPPDVIR